MKILVCVKQVPASNETRLDPVTNTIIREGIESILNPFDAFAVEEAVRITEDEAEDIKTEPAAEVEAPARRAPSKPKRNLDSTQPFSF